MEQNIINLIKTKQVYLKELFFYKESDMWRFMFDSHIHIDSACFWRFLKNNRIQFTSFDHQQSFGNKKALDLTSELYDVLKDNSLLEIDRDDNKGDLFFIFENQYVLEFLTSSRGYENWVLYINKKQYISLGGGDIA